MNYEKVSIYVNEAEQGQDKPLYLELLEMLQKNNIREGTTLRGVAGFPHDDITKATFFHPGKKSPLIVQFVDSVTMVTAVLPELKRMVPNHLIVRIPVEILNWSE